MMIVSTPARILLNTVTIYGFFKGAHYPRRSPLPTAPVASHQFEFMATCSAPAALSTSMTSISSSHVKSRSDLRNTVF